MGETLMQRRRVEEELSLIHIFVEQYMVLRRLLAGSHGPMALAGDRCAAVWHPDGTFQFIADAFHVGAGCYPASEVFYREGFCRDLSGGYGCSGQHGHWNTAVISVSVAGVRCV